MKKLLSLVVVIASAAGILWASGASDPKAAGTVPADKVFSVVFWQHSPWTRGSLPKPEEDFIAQHARDKYKIDLKLQIAPADGADAKLNAMIAGGEIPDLIQAYWGMGDTIVKEFVEQGIIVPLDSYLPKYAFLNSFLNDTEHWPYLTYDGKKVALGQPLPVQNWYTVWVRQDWLDALGMPQPKTIDDLSALALAFTAKDPDGNGKADTYGFTSVTTTNNFFGELPSVFAPFGGHPGRNNMVVRNGRLVMDGFSGETKNALAWWHQQVQAKAVDPNWTTNKYDNWRESAISGKVGIISAQFQLLREDTQSVNVFGKEIMAANPKARWVQLPAIKGPFGSYTNWNTNGTDNRFFITRKALSEPGKIEALLSWLNDVLNPKTDTYVLTIRGQEGLDYRRDSSGRIAERIINAERSWKSYYSVFRLGDEDYFYPSYKALPNDVWGKFQLTIKQPRILNVNGLIKSHSRWPDLRFYMEEMHMKFALGVEPLSNWDAFVETARKTYGLDEILADGEAQLKKLGMLK